MIFFSEVAFLRLNYSVILFNLNLKCKKEMMRAENGSLKKRSNGIKNSI